MEIDYTAWRFWMDLLLILVVMLQGIYTWFVNRTKVNKAAIDRVDGRVSEVVERVTLLERDVRHLPNHDDLGELHEKVNTIATSMGKIEGELAALVRSLSMIHEHLLNEVKR